MTFIQIIIIYMTTFIDLFVSYHMYNWYQLITQHSYIHECVPMYSLVYSTSPLRIPPSYLLGALQL
jgi:hypothetical protein